MQQPGSEVQTLAVYIELEGGSILETLGERSHRAQLQRLWEKTRTLGSGIGGESKLKYLP